MASTEPAKQGTAPANPRGGKQSKTAVLSPKQLRFASEYLVDLNATQAAIRAGYSERTARRQAADLLTKQDIQAEVQRLMDARGEKVEVDALRVLQELKAMAFYDPGEIGLAKVKKPEDIAKLPDELRRAIIGWSWDKNGRFTLKLSPKTQQLELIGRHLRMFTDKVEVTGKEGGPIVSAAVELSPEQIAQVERIKARREAIEKGGK
jgi:phage terminase small subunit